MEITFIGQGYNLVQDTSVAVELIQGLNNKQFNCFKCLVAFASPSGVSGLTPHILKSKKHIETYQIIVGLDNFGTSKEALEELLLWEVKSYVYHSRSHNIFHPKIYLFEGKENSMVIVGSNNLTEFGLVKNIEGAIMIKYTQNEESKVIKEIKNYFQSLLDSTDANLKILTQELIDDLYATEKILPNEEKRKKLHDEKYGNITEKIDEDSTVEKKISDFFGTTPLQSNPKSFKPKRKSKKSVQKVEPIKSKLVSETAKQPLEKDNLELWNFNKSSDVLISEIGKGGRWQQIAFVKKNFELFFEIPIIPRSIYFIDLKYLNDDGHLEEEIEKVKALIKESSNYNLEPKQVTKSNIIYDENNKPIIVFIKISAKKFVYHFPYIDTKLHKELKKVLKEEKGKIKRRQIKVDDLKKMCPNFPV